MPRAKRPPLIWGNEHLADELAHELIGYLNKTPHAFIARLASRVAAGKPPFVSTTFEFPAVRVKYDHMGHMRLVPEPKQAKRNAYPRLFMALAIMWERDALRDRFKRCPFCKTFFLARTKRRKYCEQTDCKTDYHNKRRSTR